MREMFSFISLKATYEFINLLYHQFGNTIREWRRGVQPVMHNANQAVREPLPSPSISASRKKQKIASSLPSQSFGGPTPSFHPQSMAAANQPSSSAVKRGPMTGAKGKKHKPVS